jgi:Zn finger protein HypA/HybF involved in hydrogenase expression
LIEKPKDGFGYIYILSNEGSFAPDIFKIGLTTNSVRQRISELQSTGVPTPFEAEKVFLVKEKYLFDVEREAHRILKESGLHHGKEFFKASLQDCVIAVQDAIYTITGNTSKDLIGDAERRAEEKRLALEQLTTENQKIEARRRQYIELQCLTRNANKSAGLVFAIGLVLVLLSGDLRIFVPVLMVGFFYYEWKKSSINSEISYEAVTQYPLKSLKDFQSPSRSASTQEARNSKKTEKSHQRGNVERIFVKEESDSKSSPQSLAPATVFTWDSDGSVETRCPHCIQKLRIPADMRIKTATCPTCKGKFYLENEIHEEVFGDLSSNALARGIPDSRNEKVVTRCLHCGQKLRVPSGKSMNVTCPSCKYKFPFSSSS